jgi:hypothetical protein
VAAAAHSKEEIKKFAAKKATIVSALAKNSSQQKRAVVCHLFTQL